MYEVLEKEAIAPGLCMMRIRAPLVASRVRPGQFVIVRADERGERVPLSIADWDEESLTLVVQDVGLSTRKLSMLEKGDRLMNIAGPLGRCSDIQRFGTVAVVSGCFGAGPGHALARALKGAGNSVISIVEARRSDWLFWLGRLESISDRLVVTSPGPGFADRYATAPLERLISEERIDRVYAIGCTFMMMEVSEATRTYGIPTLVSLMPLMVDGTGMCGACRCTIGGRTALACVEGPWFDGHSVDWTGLIRRMSCYLQEETEAVERWDRQTWHLAQDRRASHRGSGQLK